MDDDASIRDIAQAMLLHLGYEVETCAEGAAALEKYQHAMAAKRPFDAVLLDLTIQGGMGGQETLQKLRELDPQVKGIIASGYTIAV
jgi:CheY-like chemotaxis protein